MGRAVRLFEKEVSFKLGKGVENDTSNCMRRAVPHLDKEGSFRLETGVGNVTLDCMGRASASSKKKLVLG